MRYLPLLLLCSCGAQWTGAWTGSLGNKFSCSDGFEERYDFNASWVIAQQQKMLSIAPGGNCGSFEAEARSAWSANLASKDCGFTTSPGYRYVNELRSGILEMDQSGGFFGVDIVFAHVVYKSNGAFDSNCTTEMTGRLTIER